MNTTGTEIEIKYRHAHNVWGEVMVDRFYDTPVEKHVLRLRMQGMTAILCGKGPSIIDENGIKTRKEVEVAVSPGIMTVLEAAGYTVKDVLFKFRKEEMIQGCTVCWDQVPDLGASFVEIEGPSADAIRPVATALGLKDTEVEKRSYREMVWSAREVGKTLFAIDKMTAKAEREHQERLKMIHGAAGERFDLPTDGQ